MTGWAMKRRMAKLRRAVRTDDGDHWSLWVELMYAEPHGSPRFGVLITPAIGATIRIGNGNSPRAAIRDAERNVKQNPRFSDWDKFR